MLFWTLFLGFLGFIYSLGTGEFGHAAFFAAVDLILVAIFAWETKANER